MVSLKPIESSAWNRGAARHLLNRAGFGVPHQLVDNLASMTPEAAVDYLVNYESVAFSYPEPDFLEPALTYKERSEQRKGLSEDERRELQRQWQRAERQAVQTLRGWWIQRMRLTTRPLEEKMALFWHGHFATSAQKVKSSEQNYALNQVFRTEATGNLKQLVTDVGQSRAMLRYLDNDRSTRKKPNENWARELMELFTLGQGQYTEDDIKASAQAFTGWTTNGQDFDFNLTNHDPANKTFLGRTGDFDGWDIIDILFEQDVLGAFICGKIWHYFGSEQTNPEVVTALASTLRENDYELKPVLRQLFLSEAFYGDDVRAIQIKSPAQLVIKLTDDLQLDTVPPNVLAVSTAKLGQDILHPPNVKGWDGNQAWINANTLLLRYNLPAELLQANGRGRGQMMAGGGDSMMMAGDRDDSQVMADGAMMKAEKKPAGGVSPELREQIRSKMKTLPKEERQAKVKILRTGNPAQKRALYQELGIEVPAEPNPLDGVFASLSFSTAGECIAQTAEKLIDVPLSMEQQSTLLAVLEVAGPDAPLAPNALSKEKQQQLLHLLTSLAEYQLC